MNVNKNPLNSFSLDWIKNTKKFEIIKYINLEICIDFAIRLFNEAYKNMIALSNEELKLVKKIIILTPSSFKTSKHTDRFKNILKRTFTNNPVNDLEYHLKVRAKETAEVKNLYLSAFFYDLLVATNPSKKRGVLHYICENRDLFTLNNVSRVSRNLAEDMHTPDASGFTPFYLAVKNGMFEIFDICNTFKISKISQHAYPHPEDLLSAVINGKTETVRCFYLLANEYMERGAKQQLSSRLLIPFFFTN